MAAERLQKVMAAAGVGSRRLCETLITEGRVQVNGRVVTELGAKADPARDRIVVDGKPLVFSPQHVYYKVHKPRGVLSDSSEEIDLRTGETRKTVLDLLPTEHARVFPVGRLDLHSEGLVLLTDDGELANRLTHPRYQHPKTYYVLLGEQPSQEALVRLRHGVDLPDGRTAPAEVMIIGQLPATLRLSKGPSEGVWLRVVLREGKKRQIRHMTAAVGYPTLRLLRWAIGPLTLGNLELGQAAALTLDEINGLRHLVGLPALTAPKADRSAASTRAGGERGAAQRGGRRNGPGQREPRSPGSRSPGSRGPGAKKIRLQPAGDEDGKSQGRSSQGRSSQGRAEPSAPRGASAGPRKPASLKLRKAAPAAAPRKAAAPKSAQRGGRQGNRRQGSGRQGSGRPPSQGGQRG